MKLFVYIMINLTDFIKSIQVLWLWKINRLPLILYTINPGTDRSIPYKLFIKKVTIASYWVVCVFFWRGGWGVGEVRGWVNSCMDVVGDGHHRFHNFDLRSSDMDGECRTVVGFSHLKGFYLICSKVGKERVMMIGHIC